MSHRTSSVTSRNTRRITVPTACVLAVALLAGCGVEPREAGSGELTGVVTTRQDSFSLSFGDPASDTYSRVIVVSPDDLAAAYTRARPDDPPLEEYKYADIGVDFGPDDVVPLEIGGEPATGPSVAVVSEGRWRIPWSGEKRYLCFGNADASGGVSTDGCVLVDREPPAAVTVEVSIGGVGLQD